MASSHSTNNTAILQAIRVVRFLKRSRKLHIKGRYFFPCESRQSPTKGRSEIPQRVVMTNYGYPKRVVEGYHKGPLPRSRETSGRETLENRLSTRFQCRSSAGIARWCTGVPIEVPKTTHKGSLCEELGSRGIHKGSLLGHRGREECGNARGAIRIGDLSDNDPDFSERSAPVAPFWVDCPSHNRMLEYRNSWPTSRAATLLWYCRSAATSYSKASYTAGWLPYSTAAGSRIAARRTAALSLRGAERAEDDYQMCARPHACKSTTRIYRSLRQ